MPDLKKLMLQQIQKQHKEDAIENACFWYAICGSHRLSAFEDELNRKGYMIVPIKKRSKNHDDTK